MKYCYLDIMEIGDRLRDMRRQAGLTQGELGRRLGRTQIWISNRELGRIVPRWDEILDIAEACGFDAGVAFTLSSDSAEEVADLIFRAAPTDLTAVADLLRALDVMDEGRRTMVLALLRSAVLHAQ